MSDEKSNVPDGTMSVARALTELKMLGKRIDRSIVDGLFVSAYRGTDDTTLHGLSKKDADEKIKTSLQSTKALIDRRNAIKMAIVESNALTTIVIGGVTYTVAGAIERKNGIIFEKKLIHKLKENLSNVEKKIERENQDVEERLQELLGKKMESDTKDSNTVKFIEDYRNLNSVHLLDPLELRKKIETMESEIEEFETNIDVTLSEQNAITRIGVK